MIEIDQISSAIELGKLQDKRGRRRQIERINFPSILTIVGSELFDYFTHTHISTPTFEATVGVIAASGVYGVYNKIRLFRINNEINSLENKIFPPRKT